MTLPPTMRFITTSGPGAAEVMHIASGPLPPIGDNDVLIKANYAGVNRPDILQRAGSYAPPPTASPIMGLEVSGTIAAIGANVTQWKIGDAVCALTPGGGYAEYCAAPAVHCLPIPTGLSMLEAAGVPENFFTVWVNVFDTCRLKAGEKFLVHGGSSGIGLTAIQLAKAFGARVIATAGSADKCKACLDLGADRAVNYKTEDFVAIAREVTGGKGVDVTLDMIGGDYTERNIIAAAEDGRIVQIASLGGAEAKINVGRLMVKRVTLTGSTLRPRTREIKTGFARAIEAKVWPLIVTGKFKVVLDGTYPLANAADAHRRMETSAHIGKIVLVV